MKGRAGR